MWIGDQEPSCDAELKLLRTWARPAPAQLQNSAAHWQENMGQSVGVRSGGPYMLAHSLAHALMTEIALDCGYPASALKERIYALPRLNRSDPLRCGLLIYTATEGIQGTLDGLVEVAGRFFITSFARPWSISWSAREIPSVPTMTRRPETMTGRHTAQPVTVAS